LVDLRAGLRLALREGTLMSYRIACSCLLLAWTALFPPRALADAYFRTYRNALVHWTRPQVPVRVDPVLMDALGDDFVETVRAAAEVWAVSAEVPVFEVTEAASSADREIEDERVWVGYGKPAQFDTEVALTIATTDARTGEVLHVEVLLNPDVPWGYVSGSERPRPRKYDLQAVLAHEFGHALGLDEDERADTATMNPHFRRGDVHQRTLEDSDERAVASLYRQFPAREHAQSCTLTFTRPGAALSFHAWCWPVMAAWCYRAARRRPARLD
jgi:hypothetical protein